VPELPDITLYVEALAKRVEGATLESIRIQGPALLRSVDPPLAAATGRRVVGVRRLGKRVVLELEGELFLILHLMIAGRLHWSDAGASAGRGRRPLARFEFSSGTLTLTEAGTRKRASLHLVQGKPALARHDPGGLEVLEASLEQFSARLAAAPHTLKRALSDPRIFSGIGNAYSDEILHRAGLSPVKLAGRLTAAERARLFAAVQSTLTDWTDRLRAATGDRFPEHVTAFREGMAVHGRYREPCPVCGAPVQRIVYAENETNYCAPCQTQGRLLADRALSRLLKKDWPRTLEELEERKAAKRPRSEPKASEGGPPRRQAAKRPRSEPKASEGGPPRRQAAKPRRSARSGAGS
jgi:formamidopyrimidine-DNA glycosylase